MIKIHVVKLIWTANRNRKTFYYCECEQFSVKKVGRPPKEIDALELDYDIRQKNQRVNHYLNPRNNIKLEQKISLGALFISRAKNKNK